MISEFNFLMEAMKHEQNELVKAQAGLREAKLSLELRQAEVYAENSGALPGKDVAARKAHLFLECYDFEIAVIKAESALDIAKAHMNNIELAMKHHMANVRISNTAVAWPRPEGEWITDG
ncbi:MAG: hypothetical protein DRI46_08115 [Chloroflexi bacterium]|nr:MAG: hypothetical protein DRI46_08115 [Chloroflexota bacterium]